MATKRPQLKITQPTEVEPAAPVVNTARPHDELPAFGRTISTGIGLKESELNEMKEIASATGLAVNSLGRYAIRQFIMAYKRGEIDLASRIEKPPTPKNRLRM